MAIAWWDDSYEEPIFLVTNLELAEEACAYRRSENDLEKTGKADIIGNLKK
jgi:hypothetical protein